MALFKLLMTLKSRQKVMMVLQVVMPIFALMCVSLLKSALMANADALANFNIVVPVPFLYNMPLKPLSNFEQIIFNVTTCHEFYMYNFKGNDSEADKAYFGKNEKKLV